MHTKKSVAAKAEPKEREFGELIIMDLSGKKPTAKDGTQYTLNLIDSQTKLLLMVPIKSKQVQVIADALDLVAQSGFLGIDYVSV